MSLEKKGNPLIHRIAESKKMSFQKFESLVVYRLAALGLSIVTIIALLVNNFVKATSGLYILGFVAVIFQIGLILYLAAYPHKGKIIFYPYVISQGVFFGIIFKTFTGYSSLLWIAFLLTLGTFMGTYSLFSMRIVKVNNKFKSIIYTLTLTILFYYIFGLFLTMFGINIFVVNSNVSPFVFYAVQGLITITAILNYFVDFSNIEDAQRSGLSKEYEYSLAISLIATTLWVYLEILRLLSRK